MDDSSSVQSAKKNNGHGGARSGAGRPRKLLEAASGVPERFETEPFDVEGEARVDSRYLAVDWFGNEKPRSHENLRDMAGRYTAELESFGSIRFETEARARDGGGGVLERFYLLNEGQTLFLLTLSRPTARTIALRKELVQRFLAYRGQLRQAAARMQYAAADLSCISREITAGLMPIVERMERQIGGVDTKVDHLEGKVGALDTKVDALDAKVSRLRPPRSGFSKRVQERYRRTVRYRYRGLCPCCEEMLIVSDECESLGNLQYDHWTDDRSRNKVEEGWAVCAGCNAKFLGESGRALRGEMEPAFQNFHRKRRALERGDGQGEQIEIWTMR